MKKLTILSAFILLLSLTLISAWIYDDFSSGVLDGSKWEIRQDVEGQPLMDEYGIVNEGGNYVFHTQQNTIGDKRVALVPKYNFTAGDILEYNVNYISGQGNNGHILLITTPDFPSGYYGRHGIIGYNNGPDVINALGTYKIKVKINSDSIELLRIGPNNESINHTISGLSPSKYNLYIESWSGHNGLLHIDYDNFTLKKCRFVASRNTTICLEKIDPNEPVIRITPIRI